MLGMGVMTCGRLFEGSEVYSKTLLLALLLLNHVRLTVESGVDTGSYA